MSRLPCPVRPPGTRSLTPRLAACAGALALALMLAGCGNGRVPVPSLTTTAKPAGFQTLRYPTAGVALQVPTNWSAAAQRPPLVAIASSGPATIALWRYRTGRAGLSSQASLRSALSALERAARARDPGLAVRAAGLGSVDGAGAVILDAVEQINGQLRRVRSEHVYLGGAELVLEAYAPPDQFPVDDHLVFSPVRRSLALLHGGRAVDAAASTVTSAGATATTTSSGEVGPGTSTGAVATTTSTTVTTR